MVWHSELRPTLSYCWLLRTIPLRLSKNCLHKGYILGKIWNLLDKKGNFGKSVTLDRNKNVTIQSSGEDLRGIKPIWICEASDRSWSSSRWTLFQSVWQRLAWFYWLEKWHQKPLWISSPWFEIPSRRLAMMTHLKVLMKVLFIKVCRNIGEDKSKPVACFILRFRLQNMQRVGSSGATGWGNIRLCVWRKGSGGYWRWGPGSVFDLIQSWQLITAESDLYSIVV